jgi:hypothetical protein
MHLPANFKPLSIEACEVSMSLTGTPARCAATRAMPNPYIHQYTVARHQLKSNTICPAPMTPSFLTAAAPAGLEELNCLQLLQAARRVGRMTFMITIDKLTTFNMNTTT